MHKIVWVLFATVILYGIWNTLRKNHAQRQVVHKECTVCQQARDKEKRFARELARINTPEYVKNYIVNVINHGSDTLGFKGGAMEGGFASAEDADKIACYVLELSGKQCSEAYPKDAVMLYTGICGGCHGNDGKGLGGKYPDLTRGKLLGIARREAFLKAQIAKQKKVETHQHR